MSQPSLELAVFVCVASFGLIACANGGGDAPAQGKAANDAAATKPEAIAGKPVEGEGKVATAPGPGDAQKDYTLQIDPGEAKVGEESKVSIRVIPQGKWHMNLGYPTKLVIDPPQGVAVTKPKQEKDDAIKLDEESCEFAIAFTPAEAGAKTFTGEFKFAICQDEACVPQTEKLQFEVAVK